MAGGSFQTSREIFEHPIWQDVTKFRLFFYIYGQAVFSEDGVRYGDVFVNRGQYLRSYRNLARDLEYIENRQVKSYSISTIKRTVHKLVEENRLKIEETELGTLFTVVNYEQYQGFGSFQKDNLAQHGNSVGTVTEQSRNNNKNVNNDNKDNIPRKQVYENDSDEMILADFFIKQIRKNDEKFKEPNKQKWADEFRKIIELDKRDKREISQLIKWVQSDDFWKSNVLSPTKLRKQYSNLLIKMNGNKEKQEDEKPKKYVNHLSEKDILNMGE